MRIGGSSVGRRRVWTAALLATIGAAGLHGCSKQPASTSKESATTRTTYDKAKLEARHAAERRYNTSVGRERDAAALSVGLICKDMGDTNGARKWLTPLVINEDTQIAGRAQATLGLMSQERGDHAGAIEQLRAASGKLSGDDAVQARLATARSLDALGRAQEAKAEYARAAVMGGYASMPGADARSTPSSSAPIASTNSGSNFVIQVGAFAKKANADKQAAMIRQSAVNAGLGMPWVEAQTNAQGKALYAVRVGKFGSKAAALDARGRAGLQGIIAAVD